jgi:PAS domain S-box-containing protein
MMLEQADDGIMLTNTRGVILDANPRACQMLGYTREELLYSNAVRLLHPDDLHHSSISLEDLGFGGTLAHERRMRRKDGTFIVVEGRRRSIHGSKSIVILRDIAERKHAEALAREWRDRYEAAVVASGKIVYELDFGTGEGLWAGAVEATLGLTVGELEGGVARFLALIHPDDLASVKAEIDRVRSDGGRFRREYRVLRKDGCFVYVRDQGSFYGGARSPRIVGFLEDITDQRLEALKLEELKQSEEALQLAAEHAKLVVWDWDMTNDRIRWSKGAESALGLAEGALGDTLDGALRSLHPDDQVEACVAIAHAVEEGIHPWLKLRLLRADGGVITVRSKGHALHDEEGNPRRMIGLFIRIEPASGGAGL